MEKVNTKLSLLASNLAKTIKPGYLCNPFRPSPLPGKRLLGGDAAKFWVLHLFSKTQKRTFRRWGRLNFFLCACGYHSPTETN
jgi:hypothetical protein